jgi:nicotinamide mononucleotide transporter
LYFIKGLGFSGIQFTLFLILAYQGYITWKKNLDSKKQTL